MPSRQQSSLLLGWLHFTGGLQQGSTGAHGAGGGHTGAHFGAQTGAHLGGHTGTGLHGSSQICGQGSSQGAQHALLEQPTHNKAVAAKKTNVAKNPTCFFIKDSFLLLSW